MSLALNYCANSLLILCLLTSIIQSRFLFKIQNYNLLSISQISAIQFLSILVSFFILIFLFVTSDFNFDLVYFHSHSEKPLIYKLSGVWGNHEGSMLLWILILVLFNFLFSLSKSSSQKFKEITVAVQSLMIFGFVLFLLVLSNPFNINNENFNDGLGLNPVLQDPLLAIHPPILYIGYVGFSLIFSLSITGLLTSEVDKKWASIAKPWVFAAWSFLTAGIALGSYWAYYELGWGGYWFWDPVENASLMPWLSATALIHCVVVLQRRNTMQSWTMVLAILTFSLSLAGTFLVRSGVLNSVHTFASDPGRGLFILIFLFIILSSSFLLFALKSEKINKPSLHNISSRNTGIMVNNWLLISILIVVFLGTMYPLATDLLYNQSLTVGPQYYAISITPIIILFLFFMILSPQLSWGESRLLKILNKMRYILITCLTITFLTTLYYDLFNVSEILIIFLSLILIMSSLSSGLNFKSTKVIVKSNFGQSMAHAGFGIFMLAVVSNAVYSQEKIYDAKVGSKLQLDEYIFDFKNITQEEKVNFNSIKAHLSLSKNGKDIGDFTPEIRFYSDPPTITSETSIIHQFFSDVYVVMNVPQNQESISLRLHVKPFMNILWLGVVMIILGGIITAIFNRKNYRENEIN